MSASYLESMTQSFRSHYANDQDVWTTDSALRLCSHHLLRSMRATTPSSLLEVGAGKAPDARLFLEAGHSYTALDLIAHETWSDLAARYGQSFEAHQVPFQSFQSSRHFDVIYDGGCFHHQHPDDIASYLNKVDLCLRLDGLFALCVYTPIDPLEEGRTRALLDGRYAHVWNTEQLCRLLEPWSFALHNSWRLPHPNGRSFYLFAIFRKVEKKP